MKVGILTFHRAQNYGAQLQAYALSQTLINKGFDVEFIDYRQPQIEKSFKLIDWKKYKNKNLVHLLKFIIIDILELKKRYKRRRNFLKFSDKWIKRSLEYKQGKVFINIYDFLIFGSDQIWTTRFLKKFDPILWGEIDITARKKITYAPSMELNAIDAKQKEFCKEHLKHFDKISVREENMKRILSPLTEKEIQVVLDPVFLRMKEDYINLSHLSKISLPKQYVLLYTISKPTKQILNLTQIIAKKLNLPIIKLSGYINLFSNKTDLDTAGPYDFLNAFLGSSFVISSSFHGTAFSIIFEKNFYSIKREGVSGRAEALLSQLGLKDNIISLNDEINDITLPQIDYSKVNTKLDLLRNRSINFLTENLI